MLPDIHIEEIHMKKIYTRSNIYGAIYTLSDIHTEGNTNDGNIPNATRTLRSWLPRVRTCSASRDFFTFPEMVIGKSASPSYLRVMNLSQTNLAPI